MFGVGFLRFGGRGCRVRGVGFGFERLQDSLHFGLGRGLD